MHHSLFLAQGDISHIRILYRRHILQYIYDAFILVSPTKYHVELLLLYDIISFYNVIFVVIS